MDDSHLTGGRFCSKVFFSRAVKVLHCFLLLRRSSFYHHVRTWPVAHRNSWLEGDLSACCSAVLWLSGNFAHACCNYLRRHWQRKINVLASVMLNISAWIHSYLKIFLRNPEYNIFIEGERGWGGMPQGGESRFRFPMRPLIYFSTYLILPAALGPEVHSASNRN
jgi:hypothetical protein